MGHQFTNREYALMLRTYFICGENVSAALRMYRDLYPNVRQPNYSTMLSVYQRLLDHGAFHVPTHAQARGRPAYSQNMYDKVLEFFDEGRSTNDAARRFGISQHCAWKMINSAEKHPYHLRKNIKTNNSPSEGETNNELPKPSTKKTPRVRKEKIKAEPAEELPETSSRYMMRKRTAKKTAEHEEEVSSQQRTSSHTQGDAKKKRKKQLPKAKTIISSVYNYLKTEYETLKSYTGGSCDLSPLEDILKRTAAATGVSEDVVTAVLEEEDSQDSLNESSRKRARVSSEPCDENESPAEEVSDGESSDEADEAQAGNEESLIEIEENPIETLKVEIDENDEYHSTPNSGILFQVPFTKEQLSALQGSLLPREPTHTKVKLEPADIEAQQNSYFQGSDAVLDTGGEQDPLGEPMELTHTKVKREPADIGDQHTEFPSTSTTLSGRRPD